MNLQIEASGCSHIGRRANNEDHFQLSDGLGLYTVADGMGGYEGGEIASALAVEQLHDFVERNQRDPAGTWPCKEDKTRRYEENLLCAAAMAAHREIITRRSGPLRMMGSTVVTVLVKQHTATVAHVGDSRVYRLRDGQLELLTRDHSVWAEMQAAGATGPRADFPFKNQITRALGVDGNSKADVQTLALLDGDRLLLCSDGLHDPLDEAKMQQLLDGGTAATACERLVQAAYDAGGTDNITAVVVSVRAAS